VTEPSDHRVEFDFEIEFTNGGGIQGQAFRLDIDGDDIEDQEVADYVVRDLRLLMVGSVRILNKRILRERHKRRAAPAIASPGSPAAPAVAPNAPAGGLRTRTRIDLSHTLEHGMRTYPGLPGPVVCDFLSREQSRAVYPPGTEFQIGRIDMVANTGTYVDSPFHRFPGGIDLAELPLDRLADLDAVVVDVAGFGGAAIERSLLLPYELGGKAVLVRTDWDRNWATDAYFSGHPFLTEEAARHLVEEGALLVGIDSLNIDDTDDGERPAHTTLLGAGIPVCEHLTGLGALPSSGLRFSAVPVKVRGMGTFPVRAYAVFD
jgi:arylformamidase